MAVLALVAALALSAAASASASAHEFIVERVPVTTSVAAEGSGGVFHLEFKILGVRINNECESNTYTGFLSAAGASNGHFTFEHCKVVGVPKCTVPNTVVTVQNHLVTFAGALGMEFGPAGSEEHLFIMTWEGGECNFRGSYQVSGHWDCELPHIETEMREHEVVCKAEGSSLHIGGNNAWIIGTEKLKLGSGKPWKAI